MFPKTRVLFCLNILLCLVFSAVGFVYAQDDDEPGPVVRVVASGVGVSNSNAKASDETEKGSTLRGRVYYEDTGKPIRRGWIGLIKISELVVTPPDKDGALKAVGIGSESYSADKYVLTNDEGEFVIRGVKAGIYQATLKVSGVLNPDHTDRKNPLFQQITVDGVAEVQTAIGVKRG